MNPRALLSSYQAHPLVLDLLLFKLLGAEYYTWEAETVFHECMQAARAPNIHSVNRHKIRAILALHDAGAAFEQFFPFEKTIMAFNDVMPDLTTLQKPDLGQLLSGVDTIWKLRSGIFSDEVNRYMAAALLADGVMYAPKPLEAVNNLLRLHAPTGAAEAIERRLDDHVAESVGPEDGALKVQLAKIREAQVYSASVSARLSDQLEIVKNESDSTSRVHG